jgi:hypothetical protein
MFEALFLGICPVSYTLTGLESRHVTPGPFLPTCLELVNSSATHCMDVTRSLWLPC